MVEAEIEAASEDFLLPPRLRARGCNREDNLERTRQVEVAIEEQRRGRVRGFRRVLQSKIHVTTSSRFGHVTVSFGPDICHFRRT